MDIFQRKEKSCIDFTRFLGYNKFCCRDVAQLGLERTVRDREVAGSNPVIPTIVFER